MTGLIFLFFFRERVACDSLAEIAAITHEDKVNGSTFTLQFVREISF